MTKYYHEVELNSLSLSGTVSSGDWEGDSEVPGGRHYLDPYCNDFSVLVGAGNIFIDITDDLPATAIEYYEQYFWERLND